MSGLDGKGADAGGLELEGLESAAKVEGGSCGHGGMVMCGFGRMFEVEVDGWSDQLKTELIPVSLVGFAKIRLGHPLGSPSSKLRLLAQPSVAPGFILVSHLPPIWTQPNQYSERL